MRDDVLPHVADEHAASQTKRLIGLAMYARDRGDDPQPHRDHAIEALIGSDDPAAVLADAADPRRARLQSLLVTHLDADLTNEHVLLTHFGDPGVLPAAETDTVPRLGHGEPHEPDHDT
ncbi:MAG: hypothetical protein ABWZ42_02765 [Ilumatobacteraceae bacterium]